MLYSIQSTKNKTYNSSGLKYDYQPIILYEKSVIVYPKSCPLHSKLSFHFRIPCYFLDYYLILSY